VNEIVYLDVCCFKRPFDDATQERVRREAEAVAEILDAAAPGRIRLVRSPAHDFENARNPREDHRLATAVWLETAVIRVAAGGYIAARVRALAALGFAPLDASHLAFAEQSQARWFVTTDDRLLKRAANHHGQLHIEVLKPDQISLSNVGGNDA
jgi:predicted nucleic acid-binding protein